MPGLRRCGNCTTCKERVCVISRGTGCPGCLDRKRKEGCHYRRACVKQPLNPSDEKSYATTDGGSASASEGESAHRYATRQALSSSSEIENEVSSSLLDKNEKLAKTFKPLSIPKDPVVSIESNPNISKPDITLTMDSSTSTVVQETQGAAQEIEHLFPYSESIWELTNTQQPTSSILRNPRRESSLHTPLTAESTPQKIVVT